MPTQRVFISFGGRYINYYKRVKELCNQVEGLSFFTKVIPYSNSDLDHDIEFMQKYGSFVANNARGFGFWIWKPYLILKTLENLNEGDFLVYTDAGCEINPKGLPRLKEYFELLEKNKYGLLTFQLKMGCEDIKYSKRSLLEYMNATDDDMNTSQIMATVLIMKKTPYIMNHMKRILEIATCMNYEMINDITKNEYPEFIDHRHDQSIHSLLVKSILRDDNQIEKPIVIEDETFFDPYWETKGISYPIWSKRLRNPQLFRKLLLTKI